MTKRLILIRHGKSSWDDPFADDHIRALNNRGQASATAIGGWLADNNYQPETILCSDATRTRETADLIMPHLETAPELRLSQQLYHAAPTTILDVLHHESLNTIAVIGHNPGVGMAASMLVKTGPDHNRFTDYPTCATTIIDFDIENWGDIKQHTGACINFIVPRDLIGTAGQDID